MIIIRSTLVSHSLTLLDFAQVRDARFIRLFGDSIMPILTLCERTISVPFADSQSLRLAVVLAILLIFPWVCGIKIYTYASDKYTGQLVNIDFFFLDEMEFTRFAKKLAFSMSECKLLFFFFLFFFGPSFKCFYKLATCIYILIFYNM